MKNVIFKKSILTLSALALSSSLAFAATEAEDSKANTAQGLIDNISKGQLKTLRTFQGPGDLTGFVLQPPGGSPMIMYANESGDYAVYGTLLGPDGENISEADTSTYVDAYIAKTILTYLPDTVQFSEGSADAPFQITVMADPNCSACHYFYDVAKPSIDNGKLRINWILVAFVKPDSEAKAAAIMSADDPAAAMALNESGFDSSTEEGGANIPDELTDEQKASVAKNMTFMRNAGLGSTPTILFYDKNGEFKFIKGSPRDMAGFIKEHSPTDQPPVEDATE